MSADLILSIDQGTTSSRALVFDNDLNVVAVAQQEFAQHFPHDGWVEHDAEEIWTTTLAVARQAMAQAEAGSGRVKAIGVVNQRETTVVWDRASGRPVYRAIVWQDRRTADHCRALYQGGNEGLVQKRTGLLLDPYFSATKVAWILDHVDGARAAAERGELAFGTIDSFLIWRLTGGAVHATDATNASRTSLYDLQSGHWSPDLLELFQVPESVLPQVRDCAADYGQTALGLLDRQLPICGVAGDQQAALIGQGCFAPGEVKSTYGTGCFVLMNTGELAPRSENRLLTTVAYQLDGQRHYAIEGSIFVAGSGVQWLRDGLGVIEHAAQTQALAESLDDNQGVYIVPAFTGLGAPHWQPDVRGLICGLTRGTGRAHLARAMLEAVAYQTYDLIEAFAADSIAPDVLKVDGGMAANDWLMQFLSDLLRRPVLRPACTETTALGAAYLAGLQQGLYPAPADFAGQWRADRRFDPCDEAEIRERRLAGWRDAVRRTTMASDQ